MNVDSRLPIGILMVAIGVGMLVGTGFSTYVLQMTVAEPVDAEVQSTSVTEVACSVDASCDVRYRPVVTYTYTYGGERYTSDQVYPSATRGGSITRDTAAAKVSEYSPGDQITAHVVPDRPGTAYLRRAAPNLASTVFGVFGGLLALAGANGVVGSLLGRERADVDGFPD